MSAFALKVIHEKDREFVLRWLQVLKRDNIIDFQLADYIEFVKGDPFTPEEMYQMLEQAENEPDIEFEDALKIIEKW